MSAWTDVKSGCIKTSFWELSRATIVFALGEVRSIEHEIVDVPSRRGDYIVKAVGIEGSFVDGDDLKRILWFVRPKGRRST
jgi:hypothetical protein